MNIQLDVTQKHPVSPFLYMQFMEPLGSADSSMDATWNYLKDTWREDFVEAMKDLRPPMLRWGGCFASYYHWYDAVGPRAQRKPTFNFWWDGVFSNMIGTDELAWLVRECQSQLLPVVNMESEGRADWAYPKDGWNCLGTADEAAQWVDYCNNPDNRLRKLNGHEQPHNITWWQIGNETSYKYAKGFDALQTARVTAKFAKAMRDVDPSIKLIGWGGHDFPKTMCEELGDTIDLLAFHGGFAEPKSSNALKAQNFAKDPDATWEVFTATLDDVNAFIVNMREQVAPYNKHIALTEGHYCLRGRNRGDVLSTWSAGATYARILNIYARHSDVLDIATAADFCGSRWQVNAMMIPTPAREGKPYLMPVGQVMKLFSQHHGTHATPIDINGDIDLTATRDENKLYLHAVNTSRTNAVPLTFTLNDKTVTSFKVWEIATETDYVIDQYNAADIAPVSKDINDQTYTLPPAGVAAIEIEL